MTTYLTIITTVLALTQIIRITQNSINLHRQNKAIKRDLAWLKDRDITEHDFDVQKECFYLLREWLKTHTKSGSQYTCDSCKYEKESYEGIHCDGCTWENSHWEAKDV